MSVIITLLPSDLVVARSLAKSEASLFEGHEGHYGGNDEIRHEVGKRGELAVESWLRAQPLYFDPRFRLISGDLAVPDISVAVGGRSFGVEVKTWRARHWEGLGRCVAISQREAVLARSDVLIWCTVIEKETLHIGEVSWESVEVEPKMTDEVRIEGWSSKEEVAQAPEVELLGIRNCQVSPSSLRMIEDLLTFLGSNP